MEQGRSGATALGEQRDSRLQLARCSLGHGAPQEECSATVAATVQLVGRRGAAESEGSALTERDEGWSLSDDDVVNDPDSHDLPRLRHPAGEGERIAWRKRAEGAARISDAFSGPGTSGTPQYPTPHRRSCERGLTGPRPSPKFQLR